MEKDLKDCIYQVLESDDFKKRLTVISCNYNNLKQENIIRNYILEKLNEQFSSENKHHLRAFAEHPRITDSRKRVDLSIVNRELDGKVELCVEFKYQFTNDFKRFENYGKVIESDFHVRDTDLFILIVCNFDKQAKSDWDKKWGISNDLSQYIAKNDEWKARLKELFVTTDDAERVNPIEVVVDSPFGKQSSSYYFYMLSKK